MPDTLDTATPQQHRARYDALREAARARMRVTSSATPPVLHSRTLVHHETVAPGWYWTGRLGAGRALRITNISGRATAALQMWNALDTSERFNAGDTVKLQWSARLTAGQLLFSDMGRVLASIMRDDTDGCHDVLAGGSTPQSNAQHFAEPQRNTRDNFRLAAGKLGLSRRDVHACLSLFAGLRTDEDGGFVWAGGSQADAVVELRAEMDLLIALSNCPHPLDPAARFDPGELDIQLLEAVLVPDDDPCRVSCEEAVRGFENTMLFLAQHAGVTP